MIDLPKTIQIEKGDSLGILKKRTHEEFVGIYVDSQIELLGKK